MLGIRDWYQWQPDPGHHDTTDSTPAEGVSNEALLQRQQPAAVGYFRSILRRFEKLDLEQIKAITAEVGTAGQEGIDYASPAARYTLRSLPGERFTGLEMMCLLYAGFQRISPGTDLGMDLHSSFLTALELHHQQEGNR